MTDFQLSDASPDHFPGALVHWANHLRASEHNQRTFERAFEAIDRALIETAAYLAVRDTSPSQKKEFLLSELWMAASRAISPIDPDFANALSFKGLGWANPDYWSVAAGLGYKIYITDVQKARALITQKRSQIENKPYLVPSFSPAHIKAGNPVLIITLIFAGSFGIACIYGGIQLMSASGAGDTSFNFLGLELATKQAGVAAIALGAATIILTFRKVLKTVVDLGQI